MKVLFKLLSFLGFNIQENSKTGSYDVRYKMSFKALPLNWVIMIFGIYLAGAIIFDSWFVLDKTEKGSVEYFGKYIKEVGPGGFYFKVPLISRVKKVATEVRYRWELGFRTIKGTNPAQFEDNLEEAIMLTKGGHLASVYWIIQYTIDDTYNWLYQVEEPKEVIDRLSQGSMRLIIGKNKIDDILTIKKDEIQQMNKTLLQNYCNAIGLKVTINEVKLQDCGLPDKGVQAAYDAVMDAIKLREQNKNEADGYVNKTIPEAKGKASKIINDAKAYYTTEVNSAEGEVARFMGLYLEYIKDPATTKQKLWYEAMQEVMPESKKTVINEKALLNLKNF
jgi:modulator of FtsH protease HflK